jgi:CO/xanthine dehydrogenase Mo-binding subunit
MSPDTDVTPYDHGTASSRSTFHMGNAVQRAAADAKDQFLRMAAEQLAVRPEDLTARGGLLWIRGSSSNQGIPFASIRMGLTYGKGIPIIGRGVFTVPDATPLDPKTGEGEFPTVFWLYGSQAAEVEVDVKTGKVSVLRLVAAHDLGRAINPKNCLQQIEGGLVQGIGMAMFEDVVYDDRGSLRTNSFMQYKIPCREDIRSVRVYFQESYEPTGPFGAKSIGEVVTNTPAPAIADAVYNAVGVRVTKLPITPEKVFMGMQKKHPNKPT